MITNSESLHFTLNIYWSSVSKTLMTKKEKLWGFFIELKYIFSTFNKMHIFIELNLHVLISFITWVLFSIENMRCNEARLKFKYILLQTKPKTQSSESLPLNSTFPKIPTSHLEPNCFAFGFLKNARKNKNYSSPTCKFLSARYCDIVII